MILKLKREYFPLLLAVLISLNGLNGQYYKKPIESKNDAQIYRQKTLDKNKKVTLENYFNEIYYANVTIGSPPQNFSLLVSTAVSFIWVPSLVTSGKKKKTFNPRNSKTAVCQSNSWNIKGLLAPHTLYGTDNSSGLITCVDTVRFGDVTLNKQTFGLANVLDPYFGPNQRSDGILGLGFPSTNIFSSDSVLKSIEKQSNLDRNVFSIWLNLNYMNENRGGEITFGGINSDLFVGPLFYVPLSTPNEAWKIEIESVSMGSNLLDRNFQALVDVGNGCINLPKSVFNQISSILNRNLTKSFDIPCHLVSTLPPISFTIATSNYGRRTFTVDASTYTQETPFYNVCFICIDSFDSDAWVLGDPFISQFYTVFDAENQQLGFAKSVRI